MRYAMSNEVKKNDIFAQGVDIYNLEITGEVAVTLTSACGGATASGPKVLTLIEDDNSSSGQ